MLCCEVSHKVMRMETILDILRSIANENPGDFKEQFARTVLNMVVLTEYNNKTYRVDDIDWDSNPNSTFETKNGPISFIDYYKQVSSINTLFHHYVIVLINCSFFFYL